MRDRITKEADFDQPIQQVWEAITEQEKISAWFLKADFKAEVGYLYTLTAPDGSCPPIVGEVKEATPYKLVYTWIEQGKDIVTTVCWTLTEVSGGTHLELVHSGISNYKGETAGKMFESFEGGWSNCFKGLHDYLNRTVHA